MCDALSANIPQNISEDLYILSYCLVHARRQFYELPDGYDDLADAVIDLIGKIYDHDSYAKGLSAQERLAYHQKYSTPIMTQLKTYLESQQDQFEPNSIAGNAIEYVLSRFTELSQFLHYAHAPLDTNIVERALKMVIQLRNACMFYKTLRGAAFASYVQSALYSAAQNDINPCDYMRTLLDNAQLVIEDPKAWLPWRYEKTLKQIQAGIAKPEPSMLVRPD
jgi:transposase